MHIPFVASPQASLGIEWELELVDLSTRELRAGASDLLSELTTSGDSEHPKIKHELLENTLEIITDVCSTVAEAREDLASSVKQVADAAATRNLGLMCSGSHPFTHYSTQQISPNPRYAELVDGLQWLGRRLQIFGVHFHVGVRSVEKVVPIVNALTAYIPHLLALSASSPYWLGEDTGLASARTKIFENLPRAGLPLQLSGWDQFESYLNSLISTRTIESIREVWWDIRPHPDFGTVELRVCDGLPTLDEVTAIAALCQSLVERLDRQLDQGYTLPVPAPWALRENKWRAARYGLDAQIIADERGTVVPVRQAIVDLVEELTPTARRLGCAEELGGIERILNSGASYQRQRAVALAHGGDLTKVVDSLLLEMREGLAA